MITILGVVYRLIMLNPDDFNERVFRHYQQLRQGVFHTDSLINRYREASDLLYATGAAQREIARWSGDSDLDSLPIDFSRHCDSIAKWFNYRMEYLDSVLRDSYIVHFLDVEPLTARQARSNGDAIYNLQGQRMPSMAKLSPGLYIRNGRKYFVRKQRK